MRNTMRLSILKKRAITEQADKSRQVATLARAQLHHRIPTKPSQRPTIRQPTPHRPIQDPMTAATRLGTKTNLRIPRALRLIDPKRATIGGLERLLIRTKLRK